MMDETFLRMCIKGKDILKRQWTPKAGDRVLTKWNSDENKIELDYLSKDFISKEASVLLRRITDVWLPRQEDLQKIALEEGHWVYDSGYKKVDYLSQWDLSNSFISWHKMISFYTPKSQFKLCMDSFNKMWLCFVMETCYNKTWNGSTWEGIK